MIVEAEVVAARYRVYFFVQKSKTPVRE